MVATCYSAKGQNAEAEKVLANVIAKYETSQYSATREFNSDVMRYAQVLDTAGKSYAAVPKLENILRIPMAAYQEAEALYRLGYSAGRVSQYQKSKNAFQRLIARFPQSPYAAEARKNIDILAKSGH